MADRAEGEEDEKPVREDDKEGVPARFRNRDPLPRILLGPACSELGYVNVLFRTTSREERDTLRELVRAFAAELRLSHDADALDDVYGWLQDHYGDGSKDGLERTRVLRAFFPVGNSREVAAEFRAHSDLIAGDYEDDPLMQAVKAGTVLRYFADCARNREGNGHNREGSGHNREGSGDKRGDRGGEQMDRVPQWQWVVRVDTSVVVNFANLVYYLRSLDSKQIELAAENPFTMPLPAKPKLEDFAHRSFQWLGHAMTGMTAVESQTHFNYEPFYRGASSVFPDYNSAKLYMLNKDTVTVLADEYVHNNTYWNNEDVMVGLMADNFNHRLASLTRGGDTDGDDDVPAVLAPTDVYGLETSYSSAAAVKLCGPKFFVPLRPEDGYSPDAIEEHANIYKKEEHQNIVSDITGCDCTNWIAYPPAKTQDTKALYKYLLNKCPFKDLYWDGELEWL
ncbi:galactosyltransferase [Gregarina niphandrodes]|uniref:Galactosyltransferase n=1 Tax=Gregarina niphandrodes TaxID=110365 RepID=A0A023B3B9_GRENI|nr:galactosyltransferase [Gregarina niphandrodes]EZG55207.1 galactosyltransferase [Gregarina niphandrodes]|eukprot:XP_011131734.1 galactosyltransferase [Gregarina niphandrodes]